MIVRTDAIVLRSIEYGETSLIVSLFTRLHGRMSVMARGARRPKSRFGSALQPMACVEAMYYHRPGRDLQTLKEASHIARLAHLGQEVDRLAAGFRIVELLRGLTEVGDPNPLLFNASLQALLHLDAAAARAENVLPHFQLRLASILGFSPHVRREDVEAIGAEGGAVALDRGTIHPPGAAGPEGLAASRAAVRAFAVFARTDLETALRLRLPEDVYDETLRLVDSYLRYHVEGRYPDRAAAVLRQLRRP